AAYVHFGQRDSPASQPGAQDRPGWRVAVAAQRAPRDHHRSDVLEMRHDAVHEKLDPAVVGREIRRDDKRRGRLLLAVLAQGISGSYAVHALNRSMQARPDGRWAATLSAP